MLLALVLSFVTADEPLRVAAAADLQRAFTALQPELEKTIGRKITFSFAASGLLAQQIQEGAPFAAYVSANREWSDKLVKSKKCRAPAKVFAKGRLALVGPLALARKPTLDQLDTAKKIAIANPKLAPYGAAALVVLKKQKNFAELERKLVIADNVAQALQLLDTGNVDLAITSPALLDFMRPYLPLADHPPLELTAITCATGGDTFVDLLLGADMKARLPQLGLDAP